MKNVLFVLLLTGLIGIGSSCVYAQDVDKGLVAHYTFNEGHGVYINDQTGNAKPAKIVGAVWVQGKNGAALDFEGPGDYIECGDAPIARVSNGMTIAVWLKINSISQQNLGSHGTWTLWVDSAGKPYFEIYDAKTERFESLVTEDKITFDNVKSDWQHIAITQDPARGILEMYINGRLSNSRPSIDGNYKYWRSLLRLGWNMSGLMGDFRLYDRGLSADEVAVLYKNCPKGTDLQPLKARLKLNTYFFYKSGKMVGEVWLSDIRKPEGVSSIDVDLLAQGKNKPLLKQVIKDIDKPGRRKVEFSTSGFKPGEYEFRAVAKGVNGEVLASASVFRNIPKKPTWFGSKAGKSDKVMLPYTPIKLRNISAANDQKSNIAVDCWGRTYKFGGIPFPTQITTAGQDILAGPIRLIGKIDGKDIVWKSEPYRINKKSDTKITMTQVSSDTSLKLTVDGIIEYDGMMLFNCKIDASKPVSLDELRFELPLKPEYATIMYQYRDRLTKAPGLVPKEGLVRPFNPAIWIGNEDIGMQWFTDTDRYWSLADPDKAIEVSKDDKEVVLRLNLVTKPVQLGEKPAAGSEQSSLSYTVGLQATPIKPIGKNAWDTRISSAQVYGREYSMLTDKVDGKIVLDDFKDKGVRTVMLMNWTNVLSAPWPTGHVEEFRNLVKEIHKRGMKIIPYFGLQFSDLAPDYDTFVDDFKSGNSFGYDGYVDNYPPQPAQWTIGPCPRSEWSDYMVAGAERLMDEFDIDGLYLDGLGIGLLGCTNTYHGCGYTKADGSIGGTSSLLDARDLIRRLYTVVKSRKPDGLIDLHNSSHMCASTMAWATGKWDGETILSALRGTGNAKPEDYVLDLVSLAGFRAQFYGKQWGVSSEFVCYYLPYPFARQFALTMLHDVPVRAHNSKPGELAFLSSIWKTMDNFGQKDAAWLPYWKNSEYVKASPEGAYVSLYKHPKNGVLAVISNLGKEKARVEVDFNLGKFGILPETASAIDALAEKPLQIDNGKLVIDLDAVDWRLVWIKPAHSAGEYK